MKCKLANSVYSRDKLYQNKEMGEWIDYKKYNYRTSRITL